MLHTCPGWSVQQSVLSNEECDALRKIIVSRLLRSVGVWFASVNEKTRRTISTGVKFLSTTAIAMKLPTTREISTHLHLDDLNYRVNEAASQKMSLKSVLAIITGPGNEPQMWHRDNISRSYRELDAVTAVKQWYDGDDSIWFEGGRKQNAAKREPWRRDAVSPRCNPQRCIYPKEDEAIENNCAC